MKLLFLEGLTSPAAIRLIMDFSSLRMGLGSGGGTFSCSSDMVAACKIYFEGCHNVLSQITLDDFD